MAGQPIKVDLPSLGGGLNQSSAPSQIADNESPILINWYPEENRLVRRKGCTRITSEAYGENIHGMAAYKRASGWEIVLGAITGLAKMDGTVIVAIPSSDDLSVPSVEKQWSLEQYQNVIYGCRQDGIQLVRYDASEASPSGIPPPTSAPTIADGGAGSLVSGDYVAAVAFRNGLTGAISNISPLSSTLALGASKKIQWTNIPTPPASQADSRVLYRSVANMIGVQYRVTILTDTSTTTYLDDIGPDYLSDQANLDNGLPPGGIKMLTIWRERAFVTDGRDLFFSRRYFPESFGEFNYISIAPDDGHVMSGIVPYGDRMLVAKTNAMYYLLGTGPENFTVRTLDDKSGCYSHASMQTMEGLAIWFGGNQFYRTDGSQVFGIGDIKVRKVLEEIPPAYYDRVQGVFYDKYKWYVARVPGPDGNPKWTVVYSLKNGTWHLSQYHANLSYSPSQFREFTDEYYGRIVYASYGDGHLYQLFNGDTDNGDLITSTWRSKAFDFTQKGVYKRNKRLSFLFYPTNPDETRSGSVTARLYHDLSSTPENTRSLDVNEIVDYARLGLSSKSKSAKLIQYEVEYTGQPQMELAEMSYEAIQYPRGGKVL